MSGSGVLVLTHPFEGFSQGKGVDTAIDSALQDDQTDVVGIKVSGGRKDEPIGCAEDYDAWIEDIDGYGRVDAENVTEIAREYEQIDLGGYYKHQCVGRTKRSFSNEGIDINIADEYTQAMNNFEYIL
jgi:hypothetical protein